MNAALTAIVALVIVYAFICLFVAALQNNIAFHPTRTLEATPEDIGLRYEDVTFRTEDGLRLHGWFVPADDARGTVLFCHGNAGNISHRLHSLMLFQELGLSVLSFDYRGFGRSEGRPGESGLYADARAAWRHLTEERGFASDRIVVFGRSIGAAVAIELATRVTPAALVAESAFTSAADIARVHYAWLPVRLLLRLRFDSASRIDRVSAPVLIIHSANDEVIPYDMGRDLYDLSLGPKRLLTISGPHNGGWLTSRDEYVLGWMDLLRIALRGADGGVVGDPTNR